VQPKDIVVISGLITRQDWRDWVEVSIGGRIVKVYDDEPTIPDRVPAADIIVTMADGMSHKLYWRAKKVWKRARFINLSRKMAVAAGQLRVLGYTPVASRAAAAAIKSGKPKPVEVAQIPAPDPPPETTYTPEETIDTPEEEVMVENQFELFWESMFASFPHLSLTEMAWLRQQSEIVSARAGTRKEVFTLWKGQLVKLKPKVLARASAGFKSRYSQGELLEHAYTLISDPPPEDRSVTLRYRRIGWISDWLKGGCAEQMGLEPQRVLTPGFRPTRKDPGAPTGKTLLSDFLRKRKRRKRLGYQDVSEVVEDFREAEWISGFPSPSMIPPPDNWVELFTEHMDLALNGPPPRRPEIKSKAAPSPASTDQGPPPAAPPHNRHSGVGSELTDAVRVMLSAMKEGDIHSVEVFEDGRVKVGRRVVTITELTFG